MNPVNSIIELINLDTKTLIGISIWGNLAMGIIIQLYKSASKYKVARHFLVRNMVTIRFLSAFGYLCMFSRGSVPGIISVNIANSILYLCFYLDCDMLLAITNLYNKKTQVMGIVTLALSIIVFNLQEFLYHDPSLRIGVASIIIFALFLPPAVLLIMSKQTSKFKRGAGFFYIPLVVSLLPRSIDGIAGNIIGIEANRYYQTLLFGSLVLLMMANVIIYLLFMKEKADNAIEKMANFDNLTDVMNRHSFFPLGKMVFEKHQKNGTILSALFLDIDFFKQINDHYGHGFGDDVLIRFADVIKNNIRPVDICCRYGGEEFVVLASVNEEGCKNIAARILRETENISFDSEPDFHMTTSIGCISIIPQLNESLETFIGKADKSLYRAKEEGRNRMVFFMEDYL